MGRQGPQQTPAPLLDISRCRNANYFTVFSLISLFWAEHPADLTTLTKSDLNVYLWSSYKCLTLPHLFTSCSLTPFLTVSVSSLRLRRVQTVLHRDPRNQKTANPRSASSLFHFHFHWHKKINESIKKCKCSCQPIIFRLICDCSSVFEIVFVKFCQGAGVHQSPQNRLRSIESDSSDLEEPVKGAVVLVPSDSWSRGINSWLNLLTFNNHTKKNPCKRKRY